MQHYKINIDIRHLNILSATILLVNVISRFVNIPSRGYRLTVGNVQWVIEINGHLPFMVLLALLVVVGSEYIFRSHPIFQDPQAGKISTLRHWILPGMAALGGSAAMNLFPSGPRWWLGLAVVTGLLILSIIGEYFVIDRKDVRHDLAAVGLNILGLTLLAILLNAIHASGSRLAFALPGIALLVTAIALRLLDLSDGRETGTRYYALGIGLLVSELALPLFFLPLSSVTFGLLLTLATHTGVGIVQAHEKGKNNRSVVLEYLLIDCVAVVILILALGR
jgi:hypothetical protein